MGFCFPSGIVTSCPTAVHAVPSNAVLSWQEEVRGRKPLGIFLWPSLLGPGYHMSCSFQLPRAQGWWSQFWAAMTVKLRPCQCPLTPPSTQRNPQASHLAGSSRDPSQTCPAGGPCPVCALQHSPSTSFSFGAGLHPTCLLFYISISRTAQSMSAYERGLFR